MPFLPLFLLTFTAVSQAQDASLSHIPHVWQARTERVLSDIDVTKSDGQQEIQALIRTLGPLTRVEEKKTQFFNTERYYWQLAGPDIEVVESSPLNERSTESRVTSVQVWGKRCKGRIGTTGAGLSLGATLRDAQRIYPFDLKYPANGLERHFVPPNGYSRGLVGEEYGYSPYLEIDFDHDTIVCMKVVNPCPFGCW